MAKVRQLFSLAKNSSSEEFLAGISIGIGGLGGGGGGGGSYGK